jgi:hypothetical protein
MENLLKYNSLNSFLTIFFIVCSLQLFAQEEGCGTEDPDEAEYTSYPWYGNDTYLQAYYDSLKAIYGNPTVYNKSRNTANDIEGQPQVWLRIPIQFWIYRQSATVAGGNNPLPNERHIKRIMDNLNNAFRREAIPIRFYINCLTFINDPSAINVSGSKGRDLCNANRNIGAIDVHIVDDLQGAFGRYYDAPNAIVIDRGVAVNEDNQSASTFTHEIGHYFKLLHTFGYLGGWFCTDEPVSRGHQTRTCPPFYARWCNRTGDLLCDTPADPNMREKGTFDDGTCTWSWGGKDRHGDTYSPDTRNFMAYRNHVCRDNFSVQQGQVMVERAFKKHPLPMNSANAFDIFEPDNVDISASPIVVNEAQRHSFHSMDCTDSQDWVTFTYPANGSLGNYSIQIRDVIGQTNPITQVRLWSTVMGAGNIPIASNQVSLQPPVIGTGTRTFDIPCNILVRGATYLIQLSSNGTTFGQYEIELKEPFLESTKLTSPNILCANNTNFSINGHPTNATITWSATPCSLFSVCSGTGANFTTKAASLATSGSGIITATIQTTCGNVVLSKTIWVGKPANLTDIIGFVPNVSQFCPNEIVDLEVQDINIPANTNYQWTIYGGVLWESYTTNQSRIRVKIDQYGDNQVYFNFYVKAVNTCGESGTYGEFGLTSPYPYCDGAVSPNLVISPNPASEELTVEISDSTTTSNTAGRGINLSDDLPESYQATLYNSQGMAIQQISDNQRNLKLNVSTIEEGIYYLEIIYKEAVTRRRVVIKR